MRKLLGVVLVLPFLLWGGVRVYKQIVFGIDCGGHMKRAADANSIPLARQEMEVVVKYLREHGLTNGYTSVLYNTPAEDLGFFYSNMTESLGELNKVSDNATLLEKSNVLIKLRETLTHHSEGSTSATFPWGISIAPHNVSFCWWGWLSTVLGIIGVICFCWGLEED